MAGDIFDQARAQRRKKFIGGISSQIRAGLIGTGKFIREFPEESRKREIAGLKKEAKFLKAKVRVARLKKQIRKARGRIEPPGQNLFDNFLENSSRSKKKKDDFRFF